MLSSTSLIRSSVMSLLKEMLKRIEVLAELTEGDMAILSDCPIWEYNRDSAILKVFERVHKRVYGKEAAVTAIHVGLNAVSSMKNSMAGWT